jgi:putative ABC transport system permease protein
MAIRDSRGQRWLLALFMLSVVFGIAAMVAILSLRVNLLRIVDQESRNLLGADLVLQTRQPPAAELRQFMRRLGDRRTEEIRLRSMARFNSGESRFVQIRGIGGTFPFYGTAETLPAMDAPLEALAQWPAGPFAELSEPPVLVEQTLMAAQNLSPGDRITLGETQFSVVGSLVRISGESEIAGFFAPRVYIPLEQLASTGLLQDGSIARYRTWFAFNEGMSDEVSGRLAQARAGLFVDHGVREETVADRKRGLERVLGNLLDFLNLIGFTALLLGGVGIAGAVQVYLKQKFASLALLRCLGAPLRDSFMVYLLQIVVFGMLASLVGTALGVATQFALPRLLRDFLPFEVEVFIAPAAIWPGLLFGWLTATLFALLPLLAIRRVSPLMAIRASVAPPQGLLRDPWAWVVGLSIGAMLLGFALASARTVMYALGFVAALLTVLLLLALLAAGLRSVLRHVAPVIPHYPLRLALGNLYRPNNRTLMLLVTLGMGVFLLNTLYLARGALLQQVSVDDVRNAANVILLDVQPDQVADVRALLREEGLAEMDVMPVITMRVAALHGRSLREWRNDPESPVSDWVYTWEFRNTYRDHVLDNATVVAGQFTAHFDGNEPYPVSLSQNVLDDLGVGLGDTIRWDVQGIPVETYVDSIRDVSWQAGRQNFNVVFPHGTIEQAPTTFAIAAFSSGRAATAQLQGRLSGALVNVSLLDLSLVFDSITALLDRAAFVIRFMALFTLVTGITVLAGTILSSRYQRMLESVLLRTLGARANVIRSVMLLEFAVIGALAFVCGGILSIGGAWALLHFVFELPLVIEWAGLLPLLLAVVVLTLLTGLLTTRGLTRVPPLVILRKEAR